MVSSDSVWRGRSSSGMSLRISSIWEAWVSFIFSSSTIATVPKSITLLRSSHILFISLCKCSCITFSGDKFRPLIKSSRCFSRTCSTLLAQPKTLNKNTINNHLFVNMCVLLLMAYGHGNPEFLLPGSCPLFPPQIEFSNRDHL